jgi:hypothetical protein
VSYRDVDRDSLKLKGGEYQKLEITT